MRLRCRCVRLVCCLRLLRCHSTFCISVRLRSFTFNVPVAVYRSCSVCRCVPLLRFLYRFVCDSFGSSLPSRLTLFVCVAFRRHVPFVRYVSPFAFFVPFTFHAFALPSALFAFYRSLVAFVRLVRLRCSFAVSPPRVPLRSFAFHFCFYGRTVFCVSFLASCSFCCFLVRSFRRCSSFIAFDLLRLRLFHIRLPFVCRFVRSLCRVVHSNFALNVVRSFVPALFTRFRSFVVVAVVRRFPLFVCVIVWVPSLHSRLYFSFVVFVRSFVVCSRSPRIGYRWLRLFVNVGSRLSFRIPRSRTRSLPFVIAFAVTPTFVLFVVAFAI